MNYSFLMMGIIPLFVFVIVDTFAGIKAALITTVVLALLEAISSIVLFQEIDSVTLFSLFLVMILAFISYKKRDAYFIKIQPVILSGLIGIILLLSLLKDPLLLAMATKYISYYPPQLQQTLTHPTIQQLLIKGTLTMGVCMLFHGALTYFAAIKLSNWWWIAVRGIGFYLFALIGTLWARFLVF